MKKQIIMSIMSFVKWCMLIVLIPTILFIIGFVVLVSSDDVRVSHTDVIQNYNDNKTLFTELATYAQKEDLITLIDAKNLGKSKIWILLSYF